MLVRARSFCPRPILLLKLSHFLSVLLSGSTTTSLTYLRPHVPVRILKELVNVLAEDFLEVLHAGVSLLPFLKLLCVAIRPRKMWGTVTRVVSHCSAHEAVFLRARELNLLLFVISGSPRSLSR